MALALGCGLAHRALAQPSSEAYSRQPPQDFAQVEACGECHVAEYEVWNRTPHATGFKTLHRKESATKIAEKMGFKLIKRDSLCLNCHYTPTLKGDEVRAASGVSCESCHGAGKSWIELHNDYGGKGLDHRSETAEHRSQRILESRQAGMRRPSDLYDVAATCFACHTVPYEGLVNIGGHTSGSGGFELVEWTQGDIRHNFLTSFLNGDGSDNALRGAARRRLMYVVGRTLDLEYSLRGVAAASRPGIYLKAMTRRQRNAAAELRAIATSVELSEVDEMLKAVRGLTVGLDNRTALLAAADRIDQAGRRLLDRHDGQQLAALDPLLDGTAAPVARAENGSGGTRSATTAPTPSIGPRPVSHDFPTLGQAACSGCHAEQNVWWLEDPHAASIEPFLDREPRNLEIARLYGLSAEEMARGTSACMGCHGTAASAKLAREVQDGASCESCHGPAGGYIEAHREGDKALGLKRPGYIAALGLGMTELKDHARRAQTCTSCHYITDRKLIATGHPDGNDFDFVGGMARVRHWQHPLASSTVLQAAFSSALAERGPVPARDPTLLNPLAEPAPATSEDPATQPADESATATPPTSEQTSERAVQAKVVGAKNTRVHPLSPHASRGPGACSGCHKEENAWWFDDRHYSSADGLLSGDPKALRIARLFGLASGEITRGNQICMDCHGSVVTGKERREAQAGVGCESCHGPAGDYLEPHQEGDKALGTRRPGYLKALEIGMVRLKDLPVRATRCNSCHYITEQRLVSAGHPTGADFDYAGGMASVRHWQAPLTPTVELVAAFDRALEKRGGRRRRGTLNTRKPSNILEIPKPRPTSPPADGGGAEPISRRLGSIELPPFPALDSSTPIEQALVQLKRRLELLYAAIRSQGETP